MSSRSYKNKKIIIYPEYIDSSLSKKFGRKIKKELSIHKPTVQEIYQASLELGLNPVIEDKKYPARWWESSQRVVVDKIKSKRYTLGLICQKIKEKRTK